MLTPLKVSFVGIAIAGAWDYSDTLWSDQPGCVASVAGQSPIDIVSALTSPSGVAIDAQGFPDSASSPFISSTLEVNDHTWEMAWDPAHNATDPYGVIWGGRIYRLAQYHYHSPSEHAVDGQHYDLEAHHVHFCTGVNCQTDAEDDEILVIAVFMNVGEENTYLSSFWGDYQDPTTAGATLRNLANPYTAFLPEKKDYYSYLGSTTTPPCAANVEWVLMQNPVTLSQAQLTEYRTSISALGQPVQKAAAEPGVTAGWNVNLKTNNRPLQPLGSRVVNAFVVPSEGIVSDDTGSWLYPMLLVAALLAICAIAVGVYLSTKKKDTPKRAIKPRAKAKPVAPEETVPLMPAPLLAAPNLSMIVQPQPLLHAMPQAYTTRPVMAPGAHMQPMMPMGYPAQMGPGGPVMLQP